MRPLALLFALWLALSMAARALIGEGCSTFSGDPWDACASGVLHRLGLEGLLVPWLVVGPLVLGLLLIGGIRWLRSREPFTQSAEDG